MQAGTSRATVPTLEDQKMEATGDSDPITVLPIREKVTQLATHPKIRTSPRPMPLENRSAGCPREMTITAPKTETPMPMIFCGGSFSLKNRAENRAIKTGLLAMIRDARPASMCWRPLKKKTL